MKLRVILIPILMTMAVACKTHLVKERNTGAHVVVKDQSVDEKSEAFILPYRDSLAKQMDVVIGRSEMEMRTGKPESLLGNFICDALYRDQLDKNEKPMGENIPFFVLLNERGLRAPLSQGDIKVRDVFEIMPFENEIVVVELKGSHLDEMAEMLISYGGHPVSSNFRMKVEKDSVVEWTISGQAIDTSRTYTIITTDYLANGGDHMEFFRKSLSKTASGYKLRDFILDHIRTCTTNGTKITAAKDERISFK